MAVCACIELKYQLLNCCYLHWIYCHSLGVAIYNPGVVVLRTTKTNA